MSLHQEHVMGTLDVGRAADVSVLDLVERPAELTDGYETVTAEERLVPTGCLRDGEWIEATAGRREMIAA